MFVSNLSINPQNFLLGLAGGALGSKAVAMNKKRYLLEYFPNARLEFKGNQ